MGEGQAEAQGWVRQRVQLDACLQLWYGMGLSPSSLSVGLSPQRPMSMASSLFQAHPLLLTVIATRSWEPARVFLKKLVQAEAGAAWGG